MNSKRSWGVRAKAGKNIYRLPRREKNLNCYLREEKTQLNNLEEKFIMDFMPGCAMPWTRTYMAFTYYLGTIN